MPDQEKIRHYQKILNEFMGMDHVYPEDSFTGRGIVLCGGGSQYFTCAYVCIRMLRNLGCQLPIELWYRGRSEMNADMISLVTPYNVNCIDAYSIEEIYPMDRIDGWELKIYSIIHSSFREVFYLDVDNVPVKNPDYLFQSVEYKHFGSLFWPDRYQGEGSPEPWLKREAWDICEVPFRNEPEFESGQMFIDKSRCWRPLLLTFHLNKHSDFYYQWFYGDKDTFHLAWRKLNQEFGWIRFAPSNMEGWMGLYQFDNNKNVIFQHRNNAKWSLFEPMVSISGFEHEDECMNLLEQLRTKWNGKVMDIPFEYGEIERKAYGEIVSVRIFQYQIEGFPSRTFELSHDFSIFGGSNMEVSWGMEEDKMGKPVLKIANKYAPTCYLRENENGQWAGNWLSYDRRCVTLTPVVAHVTSQDCIYYYNLIEDQIANFSEFPINYFKGKGIVILGGGKKYFPCVWVLINILRQKLHCDLPIELWYLGAKEIDGYMASLFDSLNVTLRDAVKESGDDSMHGWALKPFAILHSAYSEVLFIDADNIPVTNPTFLFQLNEYKKTGALFWPDFSQLGPDRSIWKICRVSYKSEPEFESGQMVINKKDCWRALQLAYHMNLHSNFYYLHILGDKETFHMAWRILEQEYSMNPYPIKPIEFTMCQHDFSGKVLFQHRNYAKWSLGLNPKIRGFQLEEDCIKFLAELEQKWNGSINFDNPVFSQNTSQHTYMGNYMYIRVGYDKRVLELKAYGCIGEGNMACERQWFQLQEFGVPKIVIKGDEDVTCTLLQQKEGVWKGRWHDFEKMPILLISLSQLDTIKLSIRDKLFFNKFPYLKFIKKAESYEVIKLYRSVVTSYSKNKKLISVSNEDELRGNFCNEEGDVYAGTIFYLLRCQQSGDKKWAKKYLGVNLFQLEKELHLYDYLKKIRNNKVIFPEYIHPDYGVIYPFNKTVFEGPVVHYYDIENMFDKNEIVDIEAFGSTLVDHPKLAREQLRTICDFQTIRADGGLHFIDFTINEEFWI